MLSQLAINGLASNTIVFELLETIPCCDKILHWLRDFAVQHDVRFAMDDFGRGESNFRRYEQLKPDLVKIDSHLFARGMEDKDALDQLETIISRVHDDGGRVVVEGIESSDMLVQARVLGADLFQGFYLDTPHIPPHSFFEQTRANVSHALH